MILTIPNCVLGCSFFYTIIGIIIVGAYANFKVPEYECSLIWWNCNIATILSASYTLLFSLCTDNISKLSCCFGFIFTLLVFSTGLYILKSISQSCIDLYTRNAFPLFVFFEWTLILSMLTFAIVNFYSLYKHYLPQREQELQPE